MPEGSPSVPARRRTAKDSATLATIVAERLGINPADVFVIAVAQLMMMLTAVQGA